MFCVTSVVLAICVTRVCIRVGGSHQVFVALGFKTSGPDLGSKGSRV